jgi:hypothetical protein
VRQAVRLKTSYPYSFLKKGCGDIEMKKIFWLCMLFVISTTSHSIEKEYRVWGALTHSGGAESIVLYPTEVYITRKERVNKNSYGNSISFSILIKTKNIQKGVYPYIVLQDKQGKQIESKIGKNIKGTTGWHQYYTPSVFVPLHATKITVGLRINGTGKVEYYNGVIK